jgi:hypothetical protein
MHFVKAWLSHASLMGVVRKQTVAFVFIKKTKNKENLFLLIHLYQENIQPQTD